MPAFRDRPSRALYMRDYRRRKREAREAASREAVPVTKTPRTIQSAPSRRGRGKR